jgi:sigma-B regulation protein RsbU (phosphoserine phosphatase)
MTNTYLVLASLNLILGGLVFLLGLVILRENPTQRLNRVVSLMLFLGGFGSVLSALALVLPAPAPGRPGVQASFAYVWELFFPTLLLFASIFPTERSFTRRILLPGGLRLPSFGLMLYAPHVFHLLLAIALATFHPEVVLQRADAPALVRPFLQLLSVVVNLFLNVHQALFSLVDLGFGAAAVALLFGSRRREQVPRLRQQLTAIAIGLTGCLVLYASATSVPTLLGQSLPRLAQASLTALALTLGSGSIAFAIVRYKFLDIKLLARRGILYALATSVLVGVYLLVVENLNRLVTTSLGIDARVVQPVFLILALTLFQPVLGRLEEWLDRMFLRDPGDYRNVLRQLGRDLQTTIDLEDLLTRSIRTIAEVLLLRSAYLVAITEDGPVSRSGAGEPLDADALRGVADILPRLSRHEPSFRLSDPVDGLRRVDRDLLVKRLGVELMVPLRWRGETLGVLLLGEKLTATEYTSEDVALLNALAGQMAVSLQNALLLRDRLRVARIEEELSLARQIQRTMLLSEFPPIPRIEVHAVNRPSRQVGGDYYDVIEGGDGSFYVAIADVAGKGVPAALLSSMLQASLRTLARAERSVAGMLRHINTLVYQSTESQQFATFFLARVDVERMEMTFCNAGHNWPLLVRADGECRVLERGGLLLGILAEVAFEEESVPLREGDVIVFYTDGISEATSGTGELFGDDRLADLVRLLPRDLPARAVADRVLGEVAAFLGPIEPQDDCTLVVVRVLAPEHAASPDGERLAVPVATG